MKTEKLTVLQWLRRGVILVVGVSVIVLGALMVFTPGPAILVIPAGLALLATEFAWAKRLLARLKERIEQLKARMPAGTVDGGGVGAPGAERTAEGSLSAPDPTAPPAPPPSADVSGMLGYVPAAQQPAPTKDGR